MTWPVSPLGELCTIAGGGTPSRKYPEYFDGNIPWVKIGDMLQGNIGATDERITEAAVENSTAKIFPVGTVLISIFATIGRTAVLDVAAATNQAIAGLTPRDSTRLSPAFLRRYLDSAVRDLERQAKGVAQVNINMTILKDLPVPVPLLAEQDRIVAMLDDVDGLRAKRRQALMLLDKLKESVFLDMFGDPVASACDWPIVKFEEIVEEFKYGTSNKSTSSGYKALRIPNVVGGVLDLAELKTVPVTVAELKRLRLRDGDILFVRTNGNQDNVGRCAIFESEAIERQGMSSDNFIYASYLIRARLRLDIALPVFAREFMLSGAGRRALSGQSKTSAGQFNINIQGVGAVLISVPPIGLQQEFAKRIAAIEAEKVRHRVHLAKLDELFLAVQSRAFAGTLFE